MLCSHAVSSGTRLGEVELPSSIGGFRKAVGMLAMPLPWRSIRATSPYGEDMALAATPLKEEGIFDMTGELAYLKRLLKRPGQLLVLTGPPDCGKSTVLKHLAKHDAAVTLIDMRFGDYTTAESFTRRIKDGLSSNRPLAELMTRLNFDWDVSLSQTLSQKDSLGQRDTQFGLSLRNQQNQEEHTQLQRTLEALLLYMAQEKERRFPTLIIDEANVMQNWLSDDANQRVLQSFLRFFIGITKQEKLANVVLATSDYYFKYWLDQRTSAMRYMHAAIGDFPEADAQLFFQHILGFPCPSEIWALVYDKCGGRALLLERVACYLTDLLECNASDVETEIMLYLEELLDQAYREVHSALTPNSLAPRHIPPCWTEAGILNIMREMCKLHDGVMPLDEIQMLPGCGSDVVEALICYNVVHCRAKSILARDLSWYTGEWPIVMPMSRLHFFAMKKLVSKMVTCH